MKTKAQKSQLFSKKKVLLMILDGWGLAPKDPFNAIENSKTPNFDKLIREYPNTRLQSSGKAVGLPEGQSGTSEINHQVIGSGRVILQDLPKIDYEIETGTFYQNAALVNSINHAKNTNSAVHVVGILSDGKIHASIEHLFAIIDLAKRENVETLYLHLFTDGRDSPPRFAEKYFKQLDEKLKDTPFKIGTIQGRFFLDRDRDWARTQTAIDLIVRGKGMKIDSWESAINYSYNQNIGDEFFEQFIVDSDSTISRNDSVIFFHYRSDRTYQIVKSLLDEKIENLQITTFIEYSEDLKTSVAFPRPEVTQTLAQTLSENNIRQYHLSETEKYTHLTFFFNGGIEKEMQGETWKRFVSNRFVKPYYNFEPSMRAFEITQDLINQINESNYEFIVVNYPNTDMVGHTGNYEAALISAEAVDYCIGKIYELIKSKIDEWSLIITADHGNSEEMWDYTNNQPHTQHTTNPVPFILVSDIKCKLHKRESLEDIAPTILELMGINKPKVMSGESLINA
jgi:2,3-bisphosphoglycerate-independent phosphoglycerate mutase